MLEAMLNPKKIIVNSHQRMNIHIIKPSYYKWDEDVDDVPYAWGQSDRRGSDRWLKNFCLAEYDKYAKTDWTATIQDHNYNLSY